MQVDLSMVNEKIDEVLEQLKVNHEIAT